MNSPRISVIVPVYNVEKYLNECIDSILEQTYKDFELIIVDDGSTDNCPQICDNYKEVDNRIVVIHKKNGGLSDARNRGINIAKGEYVIFIDSDDFLSDENVLSTINNKIEEDVPDIIVFGMKKFFEDTEKYVSICDVRYEEKNMQLLESMIKENYFRACACNKVIKKELIEKYSMKFPIGMKSEDVTWCADIIKNANTYCCINEDMYIYRQRTGSISKDIDIKIIEDIINQLDSILKNIPEDKRNIVYNYLAYEYSVVLGLSKSKNVKGKMKREKIKKLYSMKGLLKYNLSNKVKKVSFLYKFLGIRITARILGVFIDLKPKIKMRF